MQCEEYLCTLLFYVSNTGFSSIGAQQGNVNQIQYTLGRIAVTVDDLIQQIVGIFLITDR